MQVTNWSKLPEFKNGWVYVILVSGKSIARFSHKSNAMQYICDERPRGAVIEFVEGRV